MGNGGSNRGERTTRRTRERLAGTRCEVRECRSHGRIDGPSRGRFESLVSRGGSARTAGLVQGSERADFAWRARADCWSQ